MMILVMPAIRCKWQSLKTEIYTLTKKKLKNRKGYILYVILMRVSGKRIYRYISLYKLLFD